MAESDPILSGLACGADGFGQTLQAAGKAPSQGSFGSPPKGGYQDQHQSLVRRPSSWPNVVASTAEMTIRRGVAGSAPAHQRAQVSASLGIRVSLYLHLISTPGWLGDCLVKFELTRSVGLEMIPSISLNAVFSSFDRGAQLRHKMHKTLAEFSRELLRSRHTPAIVVEPYENDAEGRFASRIALGLRRNSQAAAGSSEEISER